ncbi:hypothetical protein FSP39_005793, partial [Pinctada imbricata]
QDGNTDEATEIFQQWPKRRMSIISKSSTQDEPKAPSKESLNRRRSTFKGVASSIASMLSMKKLYTKRRSSVVASDIQRPKVRMENTYKTKPDDGKEFKSTAVDNFVYELLEKVLNNEKYNSANCSRLACDLSVLIKNRIKDLNFPRYKIICQVIIGQMGEQGMETASRCLWDTATDRCSTVSYKNNSLWAVATVHAVYYCHMLYGQF